MKKLALLAVATLLAIALAEVVARLVFGRYATSIYALDDECLHRLVPGASRTFVHAQVNGGAAIPVEVDADGYRGPELRAGATRVAVFGDSFVMAEFSRVEDTFAVRLAQALAAATGRDVEPVNGGVAGYGPDQVLVRLERELPRLRPQLLVVGVYAENDFGDLVRNKLFTLAPDGALSRTGCTIGATLREEFADAASGSLLVRLARRARRSWRNEDAWDAVRASAASAKRAFAEEMVTAWQRECADEYRETVLERDLTVRNLLRDHYDADVALEPDGAAAQHKVALMGAVLARIADVARAAGVPLCVVVIPSVVDTCDAYEAGSVDPLRFPGYVRSRLSDLVAELARARGVPLVVDLFAPFRDGGRDALFFRAPDGHWNDRGQALAAEAVASAITGAGLLRRD